MMHRQELPLLIIYLYLSKSCILISCNWSDWWSNMSECLWLSCLLCNRNHEEFPLLDVWFVCWSIRGWGADGGKLCVVGVPQWSRVSLRARTHWENNLTVISNFTNVTLDIMCGEAHCWCCDVSFCYWWVSMGHPEHSLRSFHGFRAERTSCF